MLYYLSESLKIGSGEHVISVTPQCFRGLPTSHARQVVCLLHLGLICPWMEAGDAFKM
jgi:hypothetical protein